MQNVLIFMTKKDVNINSFDEMCQGRNIVLYDFRIWNIYFDCDGDLSFEILAINGFVFLSCLMETPEYVFCYETFM
jgi:hypothetical protein